MRISISQIKEHNFFAATDWKTRQGQTPYKPNPLKYQYLLSNKYKESSNVDAPSAVNKKTLYDFEDEMNQLEEMDQKLNEKQVSTA